VDREHDAHEAVDEAAEPAGGDDATSDRRHGRRRQLDPNVPAARRPAIVAAS
jgi:hypothetical protein